MVTQNNILPFPNKSEDLSAELKSWIDTLGSVFDVFLDAYCIVDVQNQVVEFNVAFSELCGDSYRKIKKVGNFCELVKTEFCPGECPAQRVLSQGKPIRLDEVRAITKAFNHQLIFGGVPIFSKSGSVMGALMTIRDVSAENELQKKYEERKFESIIDGLTQLYNKAYTESSLYRFVKGSMRTKPGLSVAMCDIDHFKKVNDTYGHQAGDHVLSKVAQMLKEQARDTDVVGRFGGEEFIALLPNCDATGATTFCERFRARVESAEFTYEGKRIPVTVSVGTSTLACDYQSGTDQNKLVQDLIKSADTSLYYAKTSGRNRIQHFDKLPEGTKMEDLKKDRKPDR